MLLLEVAMRPKYFRNISGLNRLKLGQLVP